MAETARKVQKKATRERLLQAAKELFGARGFGVPTADIARAAGVAHGTVFVHFPTREELVEQVVTHFFNKLNRQIHDATGTACDFSELLRLHVGVLQAEEGFYTHLITQLPSLPERMQSLLFAHHATLAFHFAQVLERERALGRIVAVPDAQLFNMWIALIHYYLQNHRMFGGAGAVIGGHKAEWVKSYLAMVYKGETD